MESVLSIEHVSGQGTTRATVHLGPGDDTVMGSCRCGTCEIGALLPRTLEHVFAHVTVHDDHWRLRNGGASALILENHAQLCEYLTISPGLHWRPVPYDVTRIRDASTNGIIAMATASFPDRPADIPAPCPDIDDVVVATRLARNTKHFAVLAALCRPRLWEGPGAPLPSSTEISAMIQRNGRNVTPRAVDSQIDYLLDKLGVLQNGHTSPGGGRGWKRELLATEAIRRGIVTKTDIAHAEDHGRNVSLASGRRR